MVNLRSFFIIFWKEPATVHFFGVFSGLYLGVLNICLHDELGSFYSAGSYFLLPRLQLIHVTG